MESIQIEEFQIKVPGKVIITGEHAVIYGSRVIAIPIGLYTYLKCSSKKTTKPYEITLNLINIESIQKIKFEKLTKSLAYSSFDNSISVIDDPALLKLLISQIENQFTLMFNYALMYIFKRNKIPKDTREIILLSGFLESLEIEIWSDIPIGYGLGSSGALNVAYSKCIVVRLIYNKYSN